MRSTKHLTKFFILLLAVLTTLYSGPNAAQENPPTSVEKLFSKTMCQSNFTSGERLTNNQETIVNQLFQASQQTTLQILQKKGYLQKSVLNKQNYESALHTFFDYQIDAIVRDSSKTPQEKEDAIRAQFQQRTLAATNTPEGQQAYRDIVQQFIVFTQDKLTVNKARHAFAQTAGQQDLQKGIAARWSPTLEIQSFFLDMLYDIYASSTPADAKAVGPQIDPVLNDFLYKFQQLEIHAFNIMGQKFSTLLDDPATKSAAQKLQAWVAQNESRTDAPAKAALAELNKTLQQIKDLLREKNLTQKFPRLQKMQDEDLAKIVGDFYYNLLLAKMLLGKGTPQDDLGATGDATAWPIGHIAFQPTSIRPLPPTSTIYSIPRPANPPVESITRPDNTWATTYKFMANQCQWLSRVVPLIDDAELANVVPTLKQIRQTSSPNNPTQSTSLEQQGMYAFGISLKNGTENFKLSKSKGISVFVFHQGKVVTFNVNILEEMLADFGGTSPAEQFAKAQEFFQNFVSHIGPTELAILNGRTLDLVNQNYIKNKLSSFNATTLNALYSLRPIFMVDQDHKIVRSDRDRHDVNFRYLSFHNLMMSDGNLDHLTFQLLFYIRAINLIATQDFQATQGSAAFLRGNNSNFNLIFRLINEEAKKETFAALDKIKNNHQSINPALSNPDFPLHPDVGIITPGENPDQVFLSYPLGNTLQKIPVNFSAVPATSEQLALFNDVKHYILKLFSQVAATWPNDRKNKIGALNIKIQRIIPGPRNADSPVLSPSNLQINFEHLSSAGQDKLVINILIKELHQNICMPRPREFIAMFNEKFPEAQNLGIAFDLDGFVQQRKIDLRAKTQGRSASYDWQSVADELRQQAETSTGEISDLWDRPEKIIFQPVNSGIPDRIFSPGYLYAILIFPGGDTAIIMIPGMGVKALNYRGTAGPIVGTYVPTENKVINDQYLQTLAEELAKLSKAAIRNGLIGIKLGRQNMTNTPIITSNGYFTSSMVLADDTFTAEKINEIIQTSPEKISEAAQAAAKKISKIIQTSAEINLRRAIPASDNIPDQLITDVLEIILQDPQGDFKNLPITDLATGLLLHRYGQGIEEDQALRNYNCQDEHELTHKITTILRIVKSWQQSPRLSNYGVTRGGLITLDLRTSSMRDLEYHLSYPNQDGTIIDQTIPLRLQGPEDEELEKTIFFINKLHVLLPKDDQSFTPDQLEKLNKIQKIVINVVELVEANTRKRLKTTFEILEDGKSIQINLKLYRSRVSQTLVLQDILNQITVKQDPVTQDYTLEMIPE